MHELLLSFLLTAGPVLHPQIEPTTRLGTIRLDAPVDDARGVKIPAGVYSARYVRQPPLKDHVDTAEHPDFALLLPIAAERESWTVDALIEAGRQASGAHPWVLAIVASGTPGSEPLGAVAVRVARRAPCSSTCARGKPSCGGGGSGCSQSGGSAACPRGGRPVHGAAP